MIRVDLDVGLIVDVFDWIDGIEGIEWVVGLLFVVDVINSVVLDGMCVLVCIVYGFYFERFGILIDLLLLGVLVWVLDEVVDQLGIFDFVGGVLIVDVGGFFGFGGRLEVFDFFCLFEFLVFVLQVVDGDEWLFVLVVIVEMFDFVFFVSKVVVFFFGVDDLLKVMIQISEVLLKLCGLIDV